jgi:hypothetical protein
MMMVLLTTNSITTINPSQQYQKLNELEQVLIFHIGYTVQVVPKEHSNLKGKVPTPDEVKIGKS